MLIKSVPGGVDHPKLYALYTHTIDLLLVLLFAALVGLQLREEQQGMTQQ